MDMASNWLRNADCDGCAVRGETICAVIAPEDFTAFASLGRQRSLARGQVLIWEGEERSQIATLLSGVLKLTAATANGREQIVGLAWPSDLVGSPFGGSFQYRVSALSDARLCLFGRDEFEHFVAGQRQLERELLRRASAELDRARAFMLLLGRMSAEERLAALLLDLTRRFARREVGAGAVVVELPLRRQELADVLGLTIETISRQLRKLKDGGVIAVPDRRTIVVENLPALEAIAAG
jgi:CRP/FNR family transcriptional regulator